MFGFDISKIDPLLSEARKHLNDTVHMLKCLYSEATKGNGIADRHLRTMEYQFGKVPSDVAERFGARSLASLPYISEETVTEKTELKVEAEHGRPVTTGFYANIGEAEFKVALVGIDGRSTAEHTLPPSATIQISCAVSTIFIVPVDGQDAKYQVIGH